jgi:hypothetical protein
MRKLSFAVLLTAAFTVHAAQTTLLPARSIWKYLDDGTDQGTAWRQPGFNDSAWASGPAELGYGDGDEATVVSYGANSSRKHVTTYFRSTLDVADPTAFSSLLLRLVRDDGAVVYINGTEVWRLGMSATGTITHTTLAYASVSTSADERAFITKSIPSSTLRAGTNTVAVEIHQNDVASSDISFDLEVIADTALPAPALTRGAYLQMGTPNSVIVRWRTDNPSDSRVRYGTRAGSLGAQADDPTLTTEHSVTLTGLTPGTRYYYSIGSTTKILAGDDAGHTFLTPPHVGTPVQTRVWVLGDAGTGGTGALAVRNAYYNYAGTTTTNLWLMLGDNAYTSGTEADYQSGVFQMYPEMLRSSVLWPSLGNHDTAESATHSLAYPYYNIFTVPANGEAGGVASGTESYYSFDYGNVHFVVLDAQTSDRSPTGPMLTWLRNDLASNLQHWTIAFWHHPPYSHGSHNSDTSSHLVQMRENALPILEAGGVDLVLSGHSHAYERSFLLDGHYGTSSTLNPTMIKDGGNGSTTAYTKANAGPHEGAVYVVSGAAGKVVSGALDHPVMVSNHNALGSTILDISADRIEVKFLRDTGVIADSFAIVKSTGTAPPPPSAPSSLHATPQSNTSIALQWIDNATDEDGYRVTRCTGATCSTFADVAQLGAGSTTYMDTNLTPATVYRYRVIAYHTTNGASYSNIAEAQTTGTVTTVPTAPTSASATAKSTTSILVKWVDNASDETGYRITRCTGTSCADFAEVALVGANVISHTDENLSPATLYRYRVYAYNAAGSSARSNTAETSTANPMTPPAAPTSLTTGSTGLQVNLAWYDNAVNESGYNLERCTGDTCTNFTQLVVLGQNVRAYDDSAVVANTTYRYRVRAFNDGGTSAYSNISAERTPAN